jgi:hypothetical protein
VHLQQTKAGSRATGGPQYWFEGIPDHVRGHLQRKRSCAVILQTPYGPIETPFVALDRDYKLENGRLVKANAQHDRIQKGESKESIGEAIRRWFALKHGIDFERIEIDVRFDKQSRFILIPLEVKWRERHPERRFRQLARRYRSTHNIKAAFGRNKLSIVERTYPTP